MAYLNGLGDCAPTPDYAHQFPEPSNFVSYGAGSGHAGRVDYLGCPPGSVATGYHNCAPLKSVCSSPAPATAPVVNVNPTINTQVSPQVSPVLQQQFQPSNSPASAGTSQVTPTTQGSGGGIDAATLTQLLKQQSDSQAALLAQQKAASDAALAQQQAEFAAQQKAAADAQAARDAAAQQQAQQLAKQQQAYLDSLQKSLSSQPNPAPTTVSVSSPSASPLPPASTGYDSGKANPVITGSDMTVSLPTVAENKTNPMVIIGALGLLISYAALQKKRN